ncbi:GAF domain-containing protein [Desulfoluna sp.]|uniref:GAF domain-containing protein n=1 Tax=Desulfoluna sp. TaxID=2045199 RepID=UPI0026239B76|nr:GAF domain-containing protein [Desulfoluna sp.]
METRDRSQEGMAGALSRPTERGGPSEQEGEAGRIEQMLVVTLLTLALLTVSMWVLLRQAGGALPPVLRTYGFQAVGVIAGTVLVAAVVSYAWFGIQNLETRIRQGMGRSLEVVLASTDAALTAWMEGRTEFVEEYARDPRLVELAQVQTTIPRHRKALLESDNLKALRVYFQNSGSIRWGEGFFIISKDFINIGSMRDENIGLKNLIAEQRPDLMAAVFSGKTVFVPPIHSDVALHRGDAEPVKGGAPTSFIAAPLRQEDGSVFAVVTQRLDPSESFTRLCRIGHIGKTGETYAFDRNGFFLSRSRFEKELVGLGLLSPKVSSILTARVLRLGVGQDLTRMARSAIAGESGVDVAGYRDYRGRRVLGAWLWDADLQMGLAAEIDEEEVMITYRANRRVVVSVIGLTMVLMTLLSGVILIHAEQTQRNLKKARDEWEAVAEERHEELQRREKKFRDIFDQSVQLMAILDTSGRIMDVNRMSLEMTGSTGDELLGTLFWDGPWWSHSPEVQGKVIGAVRDAVSGSRVGFEVIHQDTRGRSHHVDFTLMPVMDEEGRVMSLLSMGKDITEQKRAEANLRASESFLQSVLDALSAHIAVLGSSGTILAVNAAWRQFGIENGSREEDGGVGTNYLELCRTVAGAEDEDTPAMYEGIRQVISGERKDFFLTYPRHSPKARRWFSLRANRLDTSRSSRVVVAHEDVTEIKAAEEALKLDEERLESLLRLSQGTWTSEQALTDFALEQGVRLTRSEVGYLHFYDEELKSLMLHAWSRKVLKGCRSESADHYPLEKAGVWADCVRERRAVIHNDYQSLAGRQGLPEGHFELVRHMSIPVFDGKRIMGVAGVGNKQEAYDESDIRQLNLFMNNLMVILKQKQAEEAVAMRATWAEGLHKAGTELSRCETIEELAAVAQRTTVQHLPLSMASVGIAGTMGEILPFPRDEEAPRLWVSRCPCQLRVMEGGQAIVVPDVDGAPLYEACRECARVHGFGSCATFPLFAGEECVGIFTIRSQERGRASVLPQLVPLIETLVGQVGYVWERCEAETHRRRQTEALRASNEALDRAKKGALQLMQDATGQKNRAEEALAKLAESQSELAMEREQLQKILETSPVGVGIAVDDRVQWINPRFSEITGLEVGDSTRKLYVNEADRKEILAEMREKGIVRDFELSVHGQNRDSLDVLSTFYTVEYERKSAILGWLVDITERKQMELEIMAARDKAEAATRAKSQFLANMSHEIRTPMNAILGFLELALEGSSLPTEIHQYLNTALSSARGLLSLINDILDISKLESGKLQIDEEPFHLATVMNQTCDIMNVKAREKGLEMHLEIHPALAGFFIGDALRLKQILINLIGNAIKFTEEGEVLVSVKPEGEGRKLRFAVTDTGIGIAPDRLAQIFEPFSQADSSITRRFGGTGLGTTISSQLVRLMNGFISVESVEGEGSTFWFTLDLRRVARFEDAEEAGSARLEPTRCFRVLLVEDVEANVKLATIRLEGQGHEVSLAWNGREALDAIGRDAFDLVLMDIQMPVMDGLEATRQIRGIEAERGDEPVPIIAMTASVTKEEREEDLEAGMDAVVSKPIDFRHLFRVMEEVVPEGRGASRLRVGADERAPGGADLPPLKGVDVEQGLLTWRNRDAFVEALKDFLVRYGSVTETLRAHFDTGALEEVAYLIHTLKGVAGNLSLVAVFPVVEEMNVQIREGRFAEAQGRLGALAEALAIVEASIEGASIKGAGAFNLRVEAPTEPLDFPVLTRLFGDLCLALEQYSPQAVEPSLSELQRYLTAPQLAPVIKELERFDFDAAGVKVMALAESLGIHMEGGAFVSPLSDGGPADGDGR